MKCSLTALQQQQQKGILVAAVRIRQHIVGPGTHCVCMLHCFMQVQGARVPVD